jgi:hypothetical protein
MAFKRFDVRQYPKLQKAWGWYNMGMLLGVEPLRCGAIAAVENHTGEPWETAKKYMEVHKVIVTPVIIIKGK